MSDLARYRRELRDRWLGIRLSLAGRQHQYGEITALRRFIAHFGIDCIFDVGANAGQYATMLRKDVGFRGPILSFEPNPQAFAKLEAAARGDLHWHVYNLALSDSDGQIPFYITAADQFSSIQRPGTDLEPIFASRNKVTSTVHVPCARLETLLPEFGEAQGACAMLLKMDTQGHDAAVATGAGETLKQMVGIQSELAVRPLYDGATNWQEMMALLREAGFLPNAVFANNKGHFPLLVEMDGLFVRADLAADGNIPII